MTQVAIQVSDRKSADTLVELLSSFNLDFVEQILINDTPTDNPETHEPFLGPEYQQMLDEEAAFRRLLPSLIRHYANMFVAIHQQQLVDYDVDEAALLERIDIKYPNQVVLLRQVSDSPDLMLHFRSPRMVRQ